MLRLTVLVDNCVRGAGLLAQHGYSVFCETGCSRILFDAGADGRVLRSNAELLGIDLSGATDIVLSHGHWDHGGGLLYAMDLAPAANVWIPAGALLPRWHGQRDIALPRDLRERLVVERGRWVEVDVPASLGKGVRLTGPVPGKRPDWTHAGLVRNRLMDLPDDVPEEQAIVFETSEGLVILAACAHYGIGNLSSLLDRTHPGRPYLALVGGLHLESAPPESVDRIVATLQARSLRCISPGHCTGWTASNRLLAEFGSHCEPSHAGKTMVFPD